MKLSIDYIPEWEMDLETMKAVLEVVEQRASTDAVNVDKNRAQDKHTRARKLGEQEEVAAREVAGHAPAFKLVTVKCEETQVSSEFQEDPEMKRIVDFYCGEFDDD